MSGLKRCPYLEVVCTLLCVGGTVDSVLIKEVSLFQGSLLERFHCIHIIMVVYSRILRGGHPYTLMKIEW